MKQFFILAAVALLTASCSDEKSSKNAEQRESFAEVRVCINDFTMSVEDFPDAKMATRSEENVSSYADVKAVTLAFYDSNGTEVYKCEHNKAVANTYTGTFGEFSFALPVGSYTMVAIGRGYYTGDVFTLTSPTVAAYSSERPRETFCHTQAVNITSSAAVNLSVTLNRICSKLDLLTTDNRPSGVTKIRITYGAGGKGFNPTTGLATDDNGYVADYSGIGTIGTPAYSIGYLFLTTDEQNMTVTLEALDNENNALFTRVLQDVPFKRNRVTKLQGALFSNTSVTAAFKVESDWINEDTYNF